MRTPMPFQHLRNSEAERSVIEEEIDEDSPAVLESIESAEEGGSGSGGEERDVWGDGKREWTGWVSFRQSVERRCLKRSYSAITPEHDISAMPKKLKT